MRPSALGDWLLAATPLEAVGDVLPSAVIAGIPTTWPTVCSKLLKRP